MCGICGAVRLDGAEIEALDERALVAMTDALVHRGPDDVGYHTAPGIALGVRRLSIVDVEAGHQPFANESGDVWSVQNGELYNQWSLRSGALARHSLRTRCDSEILPHCYEEFGAGFPSKIDGKFAVAIWDARRRELLLARDRLGVKPLYYARLDDRLLFASELKALVVAGVDTTVDDEAVASYLALGYFPAPRTPLRAARKLLPGHVLRASASGVSIEPYWEFPDIAGYDTARAESPTTADLKTALTAAIEARLMSDVPVGLMLSGGLDSTLVLALMRQVTDQPIPTFSVAFEGLPSGDLEAARTVARTYRTDHHELEVPLGTSPGDLDTLMWQLDEPIADLAAIAFASLCRLTSTHVKVALSGQGADELFGGYRKHVVASVLARAQRARLLDLAAPAARKGAHRSRLLAAMSSNDPADRLLAASSLTGTADAFGAARASARRSILPRFADKTPTDPFAAMLYLDSQLALPDSHLHYFDRVSMAHSLEVRVPFLDHHLVELAARVHPSEKVRGLRGKRILREAAEGVVPEFVLQRKKVGFMHQSTTAWMGHHVAGLARERLDDASAPWRDFAAAAAVGELVATAGASDLATNEARLLFAVLGLDAWLRMLRTHAPAQRHRQTIVGSA